MSVWFCKFGDVGSAISTDQHSEGSRDGTTRKRGGGGVAVCLSGPMGQAP